MVISVCLYVRSARASGSMALLFVWLCSVLSFCIRAFVSFALSLPSGACSRTSSSFVGWRVVSKNPVGAVSRSGLIGLVVKMVCLGCSLWFVVEG
jgi:hypothetical protein